MNLESKLSTIDMRNREFSMLFINPRQSYFHWLGDFARSKGLEVWRLGVPEDCISLIIPKLCYFSLPGELQQFVDCVKPVILRRELSLISATPEDLGHPISKETFDMFFEIQLRDTPYFITDFNWTEWMTEKGTAREKGT